MNTCIFSSLNFTVIVILQIMTFITSSILGQAETITSINDRIVQLEPMRTTRLVVGTRSGPPAGAVLQGLIHFNDDNPRGADWTEEWTDTNATITWNVKAESLAQYELAMVYRCKKGSSGSMFEINTGNSIVTGKVRETRSPYFSNSWELIELDERLSLPAGISTITLRATSKPPSVDVVMDLFSLELTPLSATQVIKDERIRAKDMRADTDWFVAAKYGLMVHWIPGSTPPHGEPNPYEDAVNDFDVEYFSKMVSETGAGYIIFHIAGHKMPAPIKTWAEVHGSGSTTERDLIEDLADALAQYNIKLILGQGLPEVGLFWQVGQEEHVKRFIKIYNEIGLRYGKKLAGTYFDGGRELTAFNVNWEGMFRACKSGNTDRLLSYNFWVFPLSTEWLDFWTGEGGFPYINFEGRYIKAGAGKGLQAHVMFPIDDDHQWWFKDMNHKIGRPVYLTKQLIEWVLDSEKKGVVPTFNIAIYQDGTVSPETLAQLKAVRRAIREK